MLKINSINQISSILKQKNPKHSTTKRQRVRQCTKWTMWWVLKWKRQLVWSLSFVHSFKALCCSLPKRREWLRHILRSFFTKYRRERQRKERVWATYKRHLYFHVSPKKQVGETLSKIHRESCWATRDSFFHAPKGSSSLPPFTARRSFKNWGGETVWNTRKRCNGERMAGFQSDRFRWSSAVGFQTKMYKWFFTSVLRRQ